jgi:hypothetical protein
MSESSSKTTEAAGQWSDHLRFFSKKTRRQRAGGLGGRAAPALRAVE